MANVQFIVDGSVVSSEEFNASQTGSDTYEFMLAMATEVDSLPVETSPVEIMPVPEPETIKAERPSGWFRRMASLPTTSGVELEEIESEYGIDLGDGAEACTKGWGADCTFLRPKHIKSAGEYVEVCRGIARKYRPSGAVLEGEGRIDGRLVAAGFNRVPPREWILGDNWGKGSPRRLADFVAFWYETQGRPEVVGSSYNAEPEAVFVVWASGMPVKMTRKLRAESWRYTLNRGNNGVNVEKFLDMARLEKKTGRPIIRKMAYRKIKALLGFRTSTLRAWLGELRYVYPYFKWEDLREVQLKLQEAPVEAMKEARVPAEYWLRWNQDSCEGEAIRACLALRERGVAASRPYRWGSDLTKLAERIVSAGIAQTLTKIWWALTGADAKNIWASELGDALSEALSKGDVPPPAACKGKHHLQEWLDANGYGHVQKASDPENDRESERAAHSINRALDRAAQRLPELAIKWHGWEYERGKRIAHIMAQVTERVKALVDEGHTVFIHGRDGELMYQLALRAGVSPANVRYGITSRPLTTQSGSVCENYREYLRATVPQEAVHVDTGFAGSIPAWFRRHGWEVTSIQMVSATDPENQMEISTKENLRDMVLRDLEHSAQRLASPKQWPPQYSHEAGGFWARLYGVCDAIGLPRRSR
jgi:hypothetical protein